MISVLPLSNSNILILVARAGTTAMPNATIYVSSATIIVDNQVSPRLLACTALGHSKILKYMTTWTACQSLRDIIITSVGRKRSMLISSMMSLDREDAKLAWVGNWVMAEDDVPRSRVLTEGGEGHGLDLVLVQKLDLVDVGILHNSGENCKEVSPSRSQRRIGGVGSGKGCHGGRLLGNKLAESRHDEGDDDF